MNPDMQKIIERLDVLEQWKAEREKQQLKNPLDDTSRNLLRTVSTTGTGSKTLTQSVTDSHGDTSTVPAAYTGTLIFETPDGRFEIPYL